MVLHICNKKDRHSSTHRSQHSNTARVLFVLPERHASTMAMAVAPEAGVIATSVAAVAAGHACPARHAITSVGARRALRTVGAEDAHSAVLAGDPLGAGRPRSAIGAGRSDEAQAGGTNLPLDSPEAWRSCHTVLPRATRRPRRAVAARGPSGSRQTGVARIPCNRRPRKSGARCPTVHARPVRRRKAAWPHGTALLLPRQPSSSLARLPCEPAAPIRPHTPGMPAGPTAPGSPTGPCTPCGPVAPRGPVGPSMPGEPGTPCGPGAPGLPGTPGLPRAPST